MHMKMYFFFRWMVGNTAMSKVCMLHKTHGFKSFEVAIDSGEIDSRMSFLDQFRYFFWSGMA